ncbi:GntR family transcriptional regulator [Aestuariispira insulae]|nr:GntR family transcriptional regulator [Aestuariispira insulae]
MARQKKTKSQQRADRIYGEIRDRICLLDYVPGDRLSEEELAEEFGISRTPLRSVLARLESEGLVKSRHGVGTFVTKTNFEELEEVYKLRIELAEIAGRLDPITKSEAGLNRIRAMIVRAGDLVEQPDQKAFARLSLDHFFEMAGIIGNAHLRDITIRMQLLTTRNWLTILPERHLQAEIRRFRSEIRELLQAMEVGDYQSVGHIWRSHISMSYHRLKAYAGETGT